MGFIHNIGCLTTCSTDGKVEEHRHAAFAWKAGRISWLGPESELPNEYQSEPGIDAGGNLVIPGLIDCHTHLLFGGWRAEEFEQKLAGASYLDILKGGGGILDTVRKTRAASDQELFTRCQRFLTEMAALGVTTVEVKSGYGLSLTEELRALRIYDDLAALGLARVLSTCLAAHTVPPEFQNRRPEYVQMLCQELLPEIKNRKLSTRFVDLFLEEGAFSEADARTIAAAARQLGFGIKLHADQITDQNGGALAAELDATSVDHLERISESSIKRLAASKTVAVLLPLASLYLGKEPAPALHLKEAGIPFAIATDFNPGSAPSYHLPLVLMLGCTLYRLSPAEVFRAGTLHAAQALGIEQETGSLALGKSADFCILRAPDLRTWLYHFESNACVRTVYRGETTYTRP